MGRIAWRLEALATLLLAGCARSAGPPPIAAGTECAACAMEASSPRFACERQVDKSWRVYDSIECLMGDAGPAVASTIWLPDYDERALHRADSLWIVKGDLATPMGGGLVAFRSRAAADSVAASSHGRVGRWTDFAARTEHAP
jgi:nitrous oxide reductase accessory protein NosL